MHLNKEFLIGGMPAKELRKLLKRTAFSPEEFLRLLPDMVENPTGVWDQLVADGYLAETHSHRGTYEPTLKGRTLANASLRRYPRKTADKAVAEMLTRVQIINSSQEFAYHVEALRIFGSYLGKYPDVGDVDVAYKLRPCSSDRATQDLREKQRREAHTGYFKTFVDEVCWPQEEVLRFLKSRSPVLRLHVFEEPARLNAPFRLVFHADERAHQSEFLTCVEKHLACEINQAFVSGTQQADT